MMASSRPVLRRFQELSEAEDGEKRLDGLSEYLSEIIFDWDRTYEDDDVDAEGKSLEGVSLPVSFETIDKLGPVIQGDIVRAIYKSLEEGNEIGSTSTTQ
jgi:hypothetical protein